MRNRSKISVIVALWMAISSIIFWMPDQAQASESSEVTLSLQPPLEKVDVSPGSSGIVTCVGTVNCTKYGPDPVKVFLFAKSTTGSASVIPPPLIYTGTGGSEESKSFAVLTRVPIAHALMPPPKVTVSGYFMQRGLHYGIPSVSQTIQVKPYHDLEVYAPPPQEIGPGETARFAVRITNSGNSEDEYRCELLNYEDLANVDWQLPYIEDIPLQAGETKTVVVDAQPPETWEPEENEIIPYNLRITSIQSEETAYLVRYDIPLSAFFREGDYNFPGFSPMFALIGLGLVSMILGKKRLSHEKPHYIRLGQSKDLYGKFLMSKR